MQTQCRSLKLLLRTSVRQQQLYEQQQQLQPQQQQQHSHAASNSILRRQSVRNSFSLATLTLSSSNNNQKKNNCCSNNLTALRTLSKFTPVQPSSLLCDIPTALSQERAIELVASLKDSERESLKDALEKFSATQRRQQFEGKLGASEWRLHFRNPQTLGQVDATGSYCTFPDNWIQKKLAEKTPLPATADLWKIFFVNAVPFLAFGFLDNFIMIVAGDYIEESLGVFMSISTMAAAGLGNTVSDILGIGSAYYVERGCQILGLTPPDLTPMQFTLKACRRAGNWGRIIGITIGCLLGLSPLLFLHTNVKAEEETNDAEQKETTAKSKEAATVKK